MLKKRYLVLASFLLLLLKAGFCLAVDETLKGLGKEARESRWEITAKKMSYSQDQGIYEAEGDVVIKREGQVLSAQKATYNEKTGVAEVSGDVRLEVNGDILTGERGTFNLKTNLGEISKGRLFDREHNFYVSGDHVEKVGPNTYTVKNARLTTCDGIKPDWSVTGSEVEVTVEGYGKVRGAAFRVRDTPILYFPYAIFPVKTKRQTGLLPPGAGYSNLNGGIVELPLFWAISDQADATFYGRYMSKRGYMQGLEFRYVAEQDSKGVFLFDILSDKIKEKDLNDPTQAQLGPFPRTNKIRYWLRSRTDQQLPLGILARLDTDYVSDQDYLKEFGMGLYGYKGRPDLISEYGRPMEEIFSPTRRSVLRLSRDGEGYGLQGGSSYFDFQRPENPPIDSTPQPLGIVDFSLLPRQIPRLPLFLRRFGAAYTYIWRDTGTKGQNLSFNPAVNYPFFLGRYLIFEPAVGYALASQWFDDPNGDTTHQSRDVYEVRGKLSSILERVFDIEWKDAKKLKHKILPALTYNYRVPQDPNAPSPWFSPIDVTGKLNRITLSIENFFDARKQNEKGETSYAQWGTFHLRQGFDIDEQRRDDVPGQEKEPFLPLLAELKLIPYPDLDFRAEAEWNHKEDHIGFANLSLDFSIDRSGGRNDRFLINYQYMRGGNETYGRLGRIEDLFLVNNQFPRERAETFSGYVDVNLLYGFSGGASFQRDINLRRTIASSIWIEYKSQCWSVKVSVDSISAVDTIMVSFNLLGLGALTGK
jgi:LPS-assembly protein